MSINYGEKLGRVTKKYGIYIIFVLLFLASSIISPTFLTTRNLLNVIRQISVTGVLAFGESLLIISGMIDLSLGSVLALGGMIAVNTFLATESFFLAFLVSILVGIVFCTTSGLFVTKVGVPAFVATLAMDNIARGCVYLYTNGTPVYEIGALGLISSNYFLGIPIPIYFLLITAFVCWVLLSKTVFGRNIYATGGNQEAATASGISIAKTRIIAYAICGACAGIAGVLQMARINSGLPDTAIGYHGDAIAAAVIGGISMKGGIGTAGGTLVGAMIIGIISNVLNLAGVQSYMQNVVKGIIILLAVSFDILSKSRKMKKRKA